ncbi:superinfection immunity protein [Chryseobacterium sp. JAH]|uniref:superinfection immunity protein n=1 Tax=Chryseobacterium sp. JAH TaxID=1742858 RepID=UPI0009EA1C0B|nr:superinfection immunity protein [Chryseobacterium sp. JAH]
MKSLLFLSLSWQHILILSIIIIPYFLPTFIAYSRKKTNAGAIFALNLFLGWSLIGWVVALVWALSDQQIIINSTTSNNSNIDQLSKLNELYEKGILTDEEFTTQKQKLLK